MEGAPIRLVWSSALRKCETHRHKKVADVFANIDTAHATVVVGPGQCRISGGQTVGALGPEECSDVSVTVASPILSTSHRLVRALTSPGEPVCSVETSPNSAPDSRSSSDSPRRSGAEPTPVRAEYASDQVTPRAGTRESVLWVPRMSSTSRDQAILMDHSAEAIDPFEL